MKKLILVCTMLACGVGTAVHATIIGSYQGVSNRSHHPTYTLPSSVLMVWYGPLSPHGEIGGIEYTPEWGPLFDIADLTPANIGETFTVNSGDAFNLAANGLVDGVMDGLSFMSTFAGFGAPEAYFWYGDHTGNSGIDFQGHTIDSISVRLDALELGPEYVFGITVNIHGSPVGVPEQTSTLASLLAVSVGMMLLRRRTS